MGDFSQTKGESFSLISSFTQGEAGERGETDEGI